MTTDRKDSDAEKVRLLEEEFRRISATLYDTSIPASRLDTEVAPWLAEAVTFTDPWQTGTGKTSYRLGMAGFHAMFRFTFDFLQVNVQLNEYGDGGRALVDGVMQLKQFSWLYTYPLRTFLRYDFVIPNPADPTHFLITAHEEMWSVGDMIQAVPLIGSVYSHVFRPAFARGFLAASQVASRLQRR
jgi:hypothetical protein